MCGMLNYVRHHHFSWTNTLVLSANCCIPHLYGLYETQSANNKWNFKEKKKRELSTSFESSFGSIKESTLGFPCALAKETAKVQWTHSLHAIPGWSSAKMWGLATDVKAGSWHSSHRKRINVEVECAFSGAQSLMNMFSDKLCRNYACKTIQRARTLEKHIARPGPEFCLSI